MSSYLSSNILFFFGAGASAPFGIPTMKQFVTDFETSFDQNDENALDQKIVYSGIKGRLEQDLGKPVDLEAVFSVIDGLLNYNTEKLGLLSIYLANNGFRKPSEEIVKICKSLSEKFRDFVKNKCEVPEAAFGKIGSVYRDFFNRFALELGGKVNRQEDYAWCPDWTIFTTNYDTCIEYYWREKARIGIDTGFDFDLVRHVSALRSRRFLQENIGLQLFKLHGSINWLVEKGTNEVIEVEMEKGRSHMGRRFLGEMMIYPIAEKELYLDPYISMLLRLNRELESKKVWIIIGYSFNDPVIREIFSKESSKDKKIILVHPNAEGIFNERLQGVQGDVVRLKSMFGMEDSFQMVNHALISKLVSKPRIDPNTNPIP